MTERTPDERRTMWDGARVLLNVDETVSKVDLTAAEMARPAQEAAGPRAKSRTGVHPRSARCS